MSENQAGFTGKAVTEGTASPEGTKNKDILLARLEKAQELACIGNWIHDISTGNIWWSKELYRIFSLSPADGPVSMERFFEMIHPEDREELEAQISLGLPHRSEYRIVRADGSVRYIHEEVFFERNTKGEIICHSGIAQDITDRKCAEQALLAEKKRLAESQRIAHIGSWEHNLSTNEALWSDELFRLLGLDPKQDHADFDMFFSMVHPDDQPLLKKSIEETLSLHKPFSVEYRLNLKNGTTRMLHARAELIPDSSGEMKILRGTAQDITLLKEKEEHSDKLRKLNELILSAAGEGIYGLNTEGKTTFVNPAAAEMIGWKPDEIIGRNQHVLLHHSRKDGSPYPAEECPIFAAFKDEKKYRIDNEVFWRKDGSCFPVEYTSTPIINDQGKVEGAVVVFRDITQRKSTERKIQESEAYIRNILNTVEEGFIVVDRDYRILTANKAYCNQVSLPCEEVVGRHCYEVSHLAIHPCFEAGEECAVQQVLETGETHTTFHKHLNKDGERLYVEIKAFPNKDDAGRVISVIESIHNVTERYLLEAEQLKTQKLEAIGTLAGGIAHDFNNLLQGVFGYVSMAKLSAGYPEKVYALLDQAEKALSMSVNLTTQLLTFAKGGKPFIKKTNLRPVIENASKFALSGSSSGCRLVIDQNLWAVEADEGQIAQVIQNIVLNASEAMPDNGQVDIIAENVEIARDTNSLLPDGGKYIRIMIRDTGVGILEKHLAKIFDPYFTTKQKGSGLGLATSYSIIRNHGGMIDVISRPDSGTTFFLYFPATLMETGDANRYVETSVARSCRILVMDDDEIVLDVTREMIRALGHEVELVMNGEDAIEKYMQAFASRNPFDIVILDLTIKGGMGGAETVKNLLAIDPNVKAVVTSGYSENPVIYHFQDHGFSAVLSKPYSLDGLKDCLHTLVN